MFGEPRNVSRRDYDNMIRAGIFHRAEKALRYARAGFADYWIVNLIDRRVEVHRAPTPAGYRSVVSLAPADEIAPLAAPAACIAVAALLP